MEFLLEFNDKINQILFEDKGVSSSEVADAITNRYRVLINYDDETPQKQTGTRLIEPYVYGLTSAGNECIRAFQYSGATRRGVPKYKLFRLDRILSWNPKENDHFFAEPKKLAIAAPSYNNDGDKSMSMVFAQVDFIGNRGIENNQEPNEQPQGWESPLDKIRRERQKKQQNIERQLNNSINVQKSGAVTTKSLEKQLDGGKSDLEQDLDRTFGLDIDNNNRGAVNIGQDKYNRDAMSPEEKHDAEVMRRRDRRWQNAAENRPLYRKGSANDELKKSEEEVEDNNQE